ncbi:spore germination protein D [Geomicrobium halophilum]|uniref:Spore germination protein D n=1 Tax=Geomicrobium halophilum TaxID=549000 RepID=A0A841PRT3_9BACL|nr:spore germination lipoprotein GerD [Geomicrobium halophilum]MBB6451499.1 spore germination protein D [Geomicrobium halophilum]
MKKVYTLFLMLLFLLISGCAAFENQGGGTAQSQEYEDTKEMVIDVLKTEDGQAALEDILTDEEFQESVLMDQDFVQETVQNTLTSDEGQQYFQEIMQQPDFQKNIADSMQQENEDILKRLMKDPEYQDMMMGIMQDPKMQQANLQLFSSSTYREEMQTAIEEAFDNPSFQSKLSDLIEQQQQEGGGSQEDSGNQEDSESGDQQGGQENAGGGNGGP